MAFKKHNWIKYGRKGIQAELKIIDEDNRTLDSFKWVTSDKKAERQILHLLKKGYGIRFSPEINSDESINEAKFLKKDIEW